MTGQRGGEVSAMQREHITDGWWMLPGKPEGKWPGTKNGRDHRVWLSEPAQALIEAHLAGGSRTSNGRSMRELVAELKIERATRRTICGAPR